MNRRATLISLFAILTLISVWAFGQAESGAIDGIVTDKTGAVVVGAAVTATSVDTGLVRTATRDRLVNMPSLTCRLGYTTSRSRRRVFRSTPSRSR